MKTTLTTCALALGALLAGTAMAGDQPRSDSPGMRADSDGDGRVSRAEATAAGSQRSGEWFDKVDHDKDGYVTQEELKQARETRHGKRRGEMKARMDQRFQEADANGDEQLSLDEAQAKLPKLAERFTALDADKNGMLSRDELKRGGSGRAKPQD
jgi:Ca2+-binding EF-hand superfamily protein